MLCAGKKRGSAGGGVASSKKAKVAGDDGKVGKKKFTVAPLKTGGTGTVGGTPGALTPGFWDKAERRAMETLGSLSPGSRKKVDAMAHRTGMVITPKRSPRLNKALTGAGRDSSVSLAIPSPSSHLRGGGALNDDTKEEGAGSPISALKPSGGSPVAAVSAEVTAEAPNKGVITKPSSHSGNGGNSNGEGGDLSAVGAGPSAAMRKRRPPALSLLADGPGGIPETGTPLLDLEGGAAAGENPALRTSARQQSLRKAVLQKWGDTPTDPLGAGPVPTPQTTGATPTASMDPLAFLSTPTEQQVPTPTMFGGKKN